MEALFMRARLKIKDSYDSRDNAKQENPKQGVTR